MTRSISIILCAALLSACTSTPVAQNPADPNLQLSTDIRPGTKGQRLELTQLEGELVIPAGTSSYSIQSAPAQLSLLNLLMPPAYAQETAEGDAPIEEAQIKLLTASVNGTKVVLEVLTSTNLEDGGTLVSYRLKDVPVSEENAIIEFASPSGSFKLKGVLPKIIKNMAKLTDRIDVETTALAVALELDTERDKNLSDNELKQLAKETTVQQLRDKVYEHFVKSEKGKRFDDVVKPAAQSLLPNSPIRNYLELRRRCTQRGPRCTQQPALPPRAERALNTLLAAQVQQRLTVRQRLLISGSAPIGSRPATAEEEAKLLQMGPFVRRQECGQRRIYPCPGFNDPILPYNNPSPAPSP